MAVYLSSLNLHHFRSHDHLSLRELTPGLVVLHGPNGIGKTNILEAISMLTPGRGIRSAKMDEIQRRQSRDPWVVSARLEKEFSSFQIGTGLQQATGKRQVRIDGKTMSSQASLSEYLSCVWLTPQMDRLFLDSISQRRKFLDQLVFAFDPAHSGRVRRYDNALSQRSKILRAAAENHHRPDETWLDSLEKQMATSASAIAAARLSFIKRLQQACDNFSAQNNSPFPHASLRLRGIMEELLGSVAALEVEDLFRGQLKASRDKDALIGGAQSGPHKTDLLVSYSAKTMPAQQCSTGEQKALLIGMILAHSALIAAHRGAPPLLLLDEVAAHLDEDRRAALYDLLRQLGGQVWLTGTEENLFSAAKNHARFFEIGGEHLKSQRKEMA